MQVLFLSTVCVFAFVAPSIARDVVSECGDGFGRDVKKCSEHQFVESLSSLKSFEYQNYQEVKQTIRCLVMEDISEDFFRPSDCGKMYGKFVKDVNVNFKEKGWFKKRYSFDEISFKIIAGREIFEDIIAYLNELYGFSIIKVDGKSVVSCEKRKIWEGMIYEYYNRRDWGAVAAKCEGDLALCMMKESIALAKDPNEITPFGLQCSAKGFFQDLQGSIEGTLIINYFELEEFDFKNTMITYYPSRISHD